MRINVGGGAAADRLRAPGCQAATAAIIRNSRASNHDLTRTADTTAATNARAAMTKSSRRNTVYAVEAQKASFPTQRRGGPEEVMPHASRLSAAAEPRLCIFGEGQLCAAQGLIVAPAHGVKSPASEPFIERNQRRIADDVDHVLV
jgi:hypothetical protein